MTAQELIRAALRDLGVIAAGETPSSEEIQDGLEALQMLLRSWAAEDLTIYAETSGYGNTVASQGSYTIGASGADFTFTRPDEVLRAYLRIGGVDSQLKLILAEEYSQIAAKAVTGQPGKVFYKPDYPRGTLYLNPVPDAVYDLHWDGLVGLAAPTGITSDLDFPGEYQQALRFNLAVDLAPGYGKAADQVLVARAGDSKAAIKARNLTRRLTPVKLEITDMFRATTRFNITTGE